MMSGLKNLKKSSNSKVKKSTCKNGSLTKKKVKKACFFEEEQFLDESTRESSNFFNKEMNKSVFVDENNSCN